MPLQAASTVAIGPEDVAITLSHGALGAHLGVAFRMEDGSAVIVDLAFHRLFRRQPYPGPAGMWSAAIVPFPPVASSAIVSILRLMAEKLPGKGAAGLNYGVNLKLSVGTVQPDGTHVPREGSDGHTCATIIAEAFRAARVPLVKAEEWVEAEEHVIWGEAIECMLLAWAKVNPSSQAFAQAKVVKNNNKGFRLLPEEVAAAAQLPIGERPAAQADLVKLAPASLKEMSTVCVAPEPDNRFAACAKRFYERTAALAAKEKAAAEKKAAAENNA